MAMSIEDFNAYVEVTESFTELSSSECIVEDITSAINNIMMLPSLGPSGHQVEILYDEVIQGIFGIYVTSTDDYTLSNVMMRLLQKVLSEYIQYCYQSQDAFDPDVVYGIVAAWIEVYEMTIEEQLTLSKGEFDLYALNVDETISSWCSYSYVSKQVYESSDVTELVIFYFTNSCFGSADSLDIAISMLSQ